MKDSTKEWLESAYLDLENIRHILQDDRLTGHVAFHAQQAIEKSLKAILEERIERIPRIHSLRKLLEMCSSFLSIDFEEEIVIALDSLYLESRYPGEFGLLPNGRPTTGDARHFYDFASEVYQAVYSQLSI